MPVLIIGGFKMGDFGNFEDYNVCVLRSASGLCGYMKAHDMRRSDITINLPDGKRFHYIGWIEDPVYNSEKPKKLKRHIG